MFLELMQQSSIYSLQLMMILLSPFLLAIITIIIILIKNNIDYKNSTYYKITKTPFLSIGRNIGKYGEYLIYRHLKMFENSGAKLLFNVYIPKEDGETTEIDVLMINQKGLFVFESKNYSGWIFGNENNRNWYQTLPIGRGRSHKERFYNPIMQNRSHIKHLKNFIGMQIPIYSIIVFSERCTLKSIHVESQDITVIKRSKVQIVVSNICQKTDENILSEDDIKNLYNKLYPYTQISDEVKMQHINNIQNKLTRKSIIISEADTTPKMQYKETNDTIKQDDFARIDSIQENTTNLSNEDSAEVNMKEFQNLKCPRCGSNLVLRTANRGLNKGKQFWGCSNFPRCRYVKNIEQIDKDILDL